MPLWFWLNIPAAIVVISATAGIPLWLVLRQPNENPQDARRLSAPTAQPSAPRPLPEREAQLTH